MQAATYSMLENLKANLCATFLTILHDHAEVKQVIGTTQEVVRKVASRPEDSSFALGLGHVLLQHSTSFIVQHNAGDCDVLLPPGSACLQACRVAVACTPGIRLLHHYW